MKATGNRKNFLEYLSGVVSKNSVCAEVGVLDGEFSREIYNHFNCSKLYLIDPWSSPPRGDKNGERGRYGGGTRRTAHSNGRRLNLTKARFSKEIDEGKAIIKRGFSYDVVDDFPDNYFDFIYIDACHLYGCIKADLNMFLPKLKEKGLMCGHDYPTERSIEQYENLQFGIGRAVDEFRVEHNFEWVAKSNEDFADWALRRKSLNEGYCI